MGKVLLIAIVVLFFVLPALGVVALLGEVGAALP